jgi:hypothetical protein
MTDLLDQVDVGALTKGLRDNTRDLYDIWAKLPSRRHEFGRVEINDIIEVAFCLGTLLMELERHVGRPQHLKVIK